MSTIRVIVQIVSPTDRREVELRVDPTTTLMDLLITLFTRHDLSKQFHWVFDLREDQRGLDTTVGKLFAQAGSVEPLRLTLVGNPQELDFSLGGPPVTRSGATPPAPPEAAAEEDLEFGIEEDEAESAPAPQPAPAPPAAPAPDLTRGAPPIRRDEAPARARAAPTGAKKKKARSGREESEEKAQTERRATVRYYHRMNPDRMFPLLVILSSKQVEEIVKAKVKQVVSESFKVAEGSLVELEPVLPGCDCYPPRHTLTVDSKDSITETFWVVPRVLGRVQGARVMIRQGNLVLAEVPLEIKVSKQTLAIACGLMSLAAPYITMGLKALKLDYESQKADGFPLYQRVGGWLVENLRPEWIGLGFLGLAFLLYLWMRPKKRDVFWDVNLKA